MKAKVRIGSWLVFLLSNPFQNVTKSLSSLLIAPSSAWTSLLGEFFPRSLWVLKVLRSSSDRLEFGFWANDARKRFESCNTRRKRRSLGFRRQGSEQKNKYKWYKTKLNIVIKDIPQLRPKHHSSLFPPVFDKTVSNEFPSCLFTFLFQHPCNVSPKSYLQDSCFSNFFMTSLCCCDSCTSKVAPASLPPDLEKPEVPMPAMRNTGESWRANTKWAKPGMPMVKKTMDFH